MRITSGIPFRLAAALVLGTGFYGRQIASWGIPRNRWDNFWQRGDGLALIAGVLLLSALIFLVGTALAESPWARRRRLPEILLLVAVVASFLSQFAYFSKNLGPGTALLLWLGVAALIRWGWNRWSDRMVAIARGTCLIMTPLVPLLFLQILQWQPWDVREASVLAPPPAAPADNQRPLAVMVIFDEWSWVRVAPNGQISPSFKNLRRLTDRSLLVRDARSAGWATRYALPRFLYQRQGEVVPGNGKATWTDKDGSRPSTEVPSLFDQIRALGYRSVLTGFYIPYRGLLGPGSADRIVSSPYAYKGRMWRGEVALSLMRNLQNWTDPVSQSLYPQLYANVYSGHWRALNDDLRRSVTEAISSEPDNTLIIAHLPMPHAPFVFGEDGEYRGPYRGERMSNDSVGYARHLLYTDAVLGEILGALDRSGRLDRSLLVVTSDHAWRKEPDSTLAAAPDDVLRVPLVIKWPGQTRPMVSDDRFCALGFSPIFQAALAPADGGPPALTDSLWQAISEEGRSRVCVR